MPSYLYQFFLLTSLLSPAVPAWPQQTTAAPATTPAASSAQVSNAAAKPDYSKEPFIQEESSLKVDFQNDGTSKREAYERIRIQSDAGVQHYSVITFPYESATQSLVIDFVRVRKPDGTIVDTPPDSVQDLPAEITREAPFYSDLREKQVAVRSLSVGDVLETRAHWQTAKPLVPGQFWFWFNFSRDTVCLQQNLRISFPNDRAVKWSSPGYQPTITQEGSRRILTWNLVQLKSKTTDEQKKEQDQQAYDLSTGKLPPPDVQISSFASWAAVGAWYDGLQRDRVKPDQAIQAKATELIEGAGDDDAKMRAIYDYVSTQFRYIGVSFGIGRYQPHDASQVLLNGYGDCKDKHTLLASLLQAAGFSAYPVLINSTHTIDPDVPSPAQFDHVITAVRQGSDLVFLDSTPEVAPYGYLLSVLRDKKALLIEDGKPASLVLTPDAAAKGLQTFSIDATLNDDGTLVGKVEETDRGDDSEVVLRSAFRRVSIMQWKELAQRISYAIGFSGDVSDVTASAPDKIEQPFTLSYTYTRKNFPQWTEHRVAVALPPIIVPPADEIPSHPILLGQIGEELRYESRLVLPGGYTPQPPAAVNLHQDFADYEASYEVKDGALLANRKLVIKMREVPVKEFEAYKKFCKTIGDDYGLYVGLIQTHVTPFTYGSAIWALPYSTNPAAARAYDEARDHFSNHDLDGEITSLKRAVQIDPKFTRAWLWMGNIYAFERKTEEAAAALRSAIANDPQQSLSYKGLGFQLMSSGKFDEAASVWKQLMQVAPNDADGPEYLGEALSRSKRYAEAAMAFKAAIKLSPPNAALYTELGSAFLNADDETSAAAAYKEALQLDSSSLWLNNIGYALADANKQLPLALEYTLRAVQQEEEASGKVKLSELKDQDLFHTPNLAAYWDSLGWVYFRMGKLEDAEKYLKAAWVLSQSADMADHLGQVYEKEHRKNEAVRMFRLALSTTSDRELTGTITNRLLRLGANVERDPLKFDGGAELSHDRTFFIRGLKNGNGSAEFFLLFGSGGKVDDVKFVSGSDELKGAGKVLSQENFNVLLPDGGPEQLLRRGVLLCDPTTHCTFVLYPPGSVRSVN
jgi:tetratricopeptide (TPR) repeat protein/transglutaminase-like putative cysteine protease